MVHVPILLSSVAPSSVADQHSRPDLLFPEGQQGGALAQPETVQWQEQKKNKH